MEADLVSSTLLHSHICLRVCAIPNKYHCQSGRHIMVTLQLYDVLFDFPSYRRGNRLAIYDLRALLSSRVLARCSRSERHEDSIRVEPDCAARVAVHGRGDERVSVCCGREERRRRPRAD
eukprot:2182264-Pleurochrysis_carterae.AAC.2